MPVWGCGGGNAPNAARRGHHAARTTPLAASRPCARQQMGVRKAANYRKILVVFIERLWRPAAGYGSASTFWQKASATLPLPGIAHHSMIKLSANTHMFPISHM